MENRSRYGVQIRPFDSVKISNEADSPPPTQRTKRKTKEDTVEISVLYIIVCSFFLTIVMDKWVGLVDLQGHIDTFSVQYVNHQ